jgi:tetratricopeptide (TPR) repeat protein
MAFGGDTPESYYDEGLTAAMRGEYEAAIGFFKQAVNLDNTFLAAFHQMAKCHLRLGRAEKAQELLRKVVQVKPGQIPPRVDLGFALLETGHSAEARDHFNHVLGDKPGNARAHLGLAQCSFQEGQWSAAAELARGAMAQGGANFAALLLLGRAARLAGFIEDSVEALLQAGVIMEKTIETSPDAPEGYFLRGEVYLAREDYTGALEQFRNADDRAEPGKIYGAYGLHFTQTDVLAKEGVCYQRLGRIDKARELGERILQLDPGHKLGSALAALEG